VCGCLRDVQTGFRSVIMPLQDAKHSLKNDATVAMARDRVTSDNEDGRPIFHKDDYQTVW